MADDTVNEPRLTGKQKKFADRYLSNGMNATEAAIHAYGYAYNTASSKGSQMLRNVKVEAYNRYHLRKGAMSRDEWIARENAIATFDISPYLKRDVDSFYVDVDLMIADGYGYMLRNIKTTQSGQDILLADQDAARANIGKALGVFKGMGDNASEININVTDEIINAKIAKVKAQISDAD